MTYILSRGVAALKAWDAILLAVALTVAAFVVWPGWLGDAREAGALSERLVWMEAQRKLAVKLEKERKAAQEKIDAAEIAMINTMAQGTIRLAELEQALAEERADASSSAAVCPAMPSRVRDALNAIGGGNTDAARQ